MSDKPRSLDQHRRFFGLVRACFHHWPEAHEFQPDNEEHLRAYLLVKAGHRSIKEFYIAETAANESIAQLIPIVSAVMLHRYCWSWVSGDAIKVCAPLTTNFREMKHEDAYHVIDKMYEERHAIGIDPEQYMREAEKAA